MADPRSLPKHRATIVMVIAACSVLHCGGSTTSDESDAGNPGSDSGDHVDSGGQLDSHGQVDAGNAADGGRPECDSSVVICKSLPPACPKGEVPVVSGTCWAGSCAKASSCRSVKDCTACNADSDVCATDLGRGIRTVRCVLTPVGCTSDRTCRCLGPHICTNGPFTTCNEPTPGGGFNCDCPNCS